MKLYFGFWIGRKQMPSEILELLRTQNPQHLLFGEVSATESSEGALSKCVLNPDAPNTQVILDQPKMVWQGVGRSLPRAVLEMLSAILNTKEYRPFNRDGQ